VLAKNREPRSASTSLVVFAIVSAVLGALVAAFRPRANLVVEIQSSDHSCRRSVVLPARPYGRKWIAAMSSAE
jgi:hypothetical protein